MVSVKKENVRVKSEQKAITKVAIKMEQKATTKIVQKPKRERKHVSWDERYNECKEFRKKYNHCKIPTNFKENISLGIWVQEQRRNFKKMMKGEKPRQPLKEENIEMLDEIDFYWGFAPDPNKFPETDISWEKKFAELQQYKHSHGNFNVPMDDKGDISLSKLGKWTRVQRTQKYYRDTKRKCFTTKDRINKLTAIGFNWKGPRKMNE